MKNKMMFLLCMFLFVSVSNAHIYRTFNPQDLAEKKAVKKACVAVENRFSFTNANTTTADVLYLEFNTNAEVIGATGELAIAEQISTNGKKWKVTGIDISNLETLVVTATSSKSGLKVQKWWWQNGTVKVGKVQDKKMPVMAQGRLPMPNTANVREAVFNESRLTVTLGVPRPDRKNEFGWVELKKSLDMQKSLFDREDYHFGQPRGFSRLSNGSLFKGSVKQLTPTMQNNRLFANLLALKFNILTSALAITPVGFGELIFNDPSSPFHGKMIKEIAAHTDSMMTFWQGKMKVDYEYVDGVVARINNAFRGPIDTLSFSDKLMLTGFCDIESIGFLAANTAVEPTRLGFADDTNSLENVPVTAELKQNYPNPFNPTTSISFSLPTSSIVTLKVYNMLGQEVATVLNEVNVDEGTREVVFAADNLSSGTYIYRLTAKGADSDFSFEQTKRMTLLK